jgi:hypothetical protein
VAIRYGRLPFVDLFLSSVDKPEQFINGMDYRFTTSLCKALEQGRRGLVELLLKYGAKVIVDCILLSNNNNNVVVAGNKFTGLQRSMCT